MAKAHRLSKPIQRRDFAIDEVVIGEATGAALLLIDEHQGKPMRLTMHLIAELAEVDGKRGEISFNDVVKMAAEDIAALGELVTEALDDGPQTGGTSSEI